MRWWYSRVNGISPADSFDDRFLERLEQSAASIRHELSQSSEALKHFSGDLQQASGSVTEISKTLNDSTSHFQKGIVEPLLNLHRNQTDQTTAMNQLSQTLSHVQTSHQTLVELLKEFKSNNASLQSHLDSIRTDHIKLETVYQQTRQEAEATRKEADETRIQLTELQRLIQEKQAQFDTQLAEWNARRQHLEQTAQTLISEQAELKAALEDERIRANESERTLAKIKSIF
jgi:chromosome segregation ATPase